MKDFMMLLGFGAGLVTGMMLYKYCPSARHSVVKGEKMIIDGAEKLEEKAQEAVKKAETTIKEMKKKKS